MRKSRRRDSSASSSIDSTGNHHSTASSFSLLMRRDLSTDLQLGLGGFNGSREPSDWMTQGTVISKSTVMEVDESDSISTFYVKVYMEGIPIGRKLDLLSSGGYLDLISTINYMFNTAILWSEEDGAQAQGCHVLTYEDKEGDWLMVGDVPWEMFLSSVKRLKITRIE